MHYIMLGGVYGFGETKSVFSRSDLYRLPVEESIVDSKNKYSTIEIPLV